MCTEILYYKEPSKHYMDALPLGDGSLGAMCYSSVATDIISLNHDTLWTGYPCKRLGERTCCKRKYYSRY